MSFVLYFIYKERAKVEKPYKSYAKTIFWVNFSLSIAGLVFMFLRYEKANFLSWRIWHYLIALAILLVNPYLFIIQKKKLEANLDKFREQKRKEKWLPKARKKK
jgi:cell division protein FtsW (lipid II flippase)